jgi:hypothetical protein
MYVLRLFVRMVSVNKVRSSPSSLSSFILSFFLSFFLVLMVCVGVLVSNPPWEVYNLGQWWTAVWSYIDPYQKSFGVKATLTGGNTRYPLYISLSLVLIA